MKPLGQKEPKKSVGNVGAKGGYSMSEEVTVPKVPSFCYLCVNNKCCFDCNGSVKPFEPKGCPEKAKKEFVAQLESLMLPHIIQGITEFVDDRSDFKKGYQMGYVDAIKKVLESFRC